MKTMFLVRAHCPYCKKNQPMGVYQATLRVRASYAVLESNCFGCGKAHIFSVPRDDYLKGDEEVRRYCARKAGEKYV